MNSLWIDSVQIKNFAKLDKDIDVDVCIIGGGITGISTAYLLSKAGLKVCVLEKDKIAHHAPRQYYWKNYFSTWPFL